MTRTEKPYRSPAVFDVATGDVGPADVTPHSAPQPAEPGERAGEQPSVTRGWTGGASAWFWSAVVGLLTLTLSVAAWDFATGLIARNPGLGFLAVGLIGLVAAGLFGFLLGELAGLARLRRVEALRDDVSGADRLNDRAAAEKTARQLIAFYRSRRDMAWAVAELQSKMSDAIDGHDLIVLTERTLMSSLDKKAGAEARRATRQVAAATAMMPHAVVDVAVALALNMRAARRIGAIYGGRSGWLGSMRLVRAIIGHVLATGAVSIGDDLAAPALGGGAIGVVSRRLGEGVLNGALTSRVVAAAISVCRPMPFVARKPTSWRAIAASALSDWKN